MKAKTAEAPERLEGRDHELEDLRARLVEANETLAAIRLGHVDALIVEVAGGDQIYTLHTDDEPYRDLIEQMQEGAVVLGLSGNILYCNARFAALVGAPMESVIGTSIGRFAHPSGVEGFQALLDSRSGRCRSQFMRTDGTPLEVYLSLTTTSAKGAERLNLIVTDLRELNDANSSRDRAERESRMKDEFLAMLAHELRNPLGAISSAVQVLELTHGGGEPEARARDVIARQVIHLSHLIDDLLDVERVVSGKIRLNRRPLDLAEAVRRAIGGFTGDAALDRHIDISTEPVWVNGDAVRLEQVLTNMLANAVKYTPAGSRIRVILRADGHDGVLTVEDTGVGISPELMPYIFDMFIQGDRTLDRARGGLGIGLTLVRRLVELHGGTVEASSDGAGQGSRFTARLPQVAAAERPPAVGCPLERPESRRVLVIEDSRDAREMFRMMLEFAGHTVYEAADGLRGLEVFDAEHPDVAIVDLGLPGLDGYEVARRIRQRLDGRPMLLVALTGYGFPSDHEHSAAAGFDHHLVKPLDPSHLERLLGSSVAVHM